MIPGTLAQTDEAAWYCVASTLDDINHHGIVVKNGKWVRNELVLVIATIDVNSVDPHMFCVHRYVSYCYVFKYKVFGWLNTDLLRPLTMLKPGDVVITAISAELWSDDSYADIINSCSRIVSELDRDELVLVIAVLNNSYTALVIDSRSNIGYIDNADIVLKKIPEQQAV